MSAVPGPDPTAAGAPASHAEEAPQRSEEILLLGHHPGEGAPEPPRCLGEPVEDSVLLPGHPHVVTARQKPARWTGQAGDIETRLLGPEDAECSGRCHQPLPLERTQ